MSFCTGASSCTASRHYGVFGATCAGASNSSSRSSSNASLFGPVRWTIGSFDSTTARLGSALGSLHASPCSDDRTSDFGSLTNAEQRLFDGFEWARTNSSDSEVVGWRPQPAGSAGSSTSSGWETVSSFSEGGSRAYLRSDWMFGATMPGAEESDDDSPPASLLFESEPESRGPERFAQGFSHSSVEARLWEEENNNGEEQTSAGASRASSDSGSDDDQSSKAASSRRLSDYGLGSPFIGWGSPALQPSSVSGSESEEREQATAGSAPETTTALERAAEAGWAATGELGTALPRRLTV